MEKRRRERINKCLDELKVILMDVNKKEVRDSSIFIYFLFIYSFVGLFIYLLNIAS